MSNNIKIVIGSWGSYNECNERALGSKWLDLSDYSDWDEIVEELKKEGFELDGIDEELFIQDVEGIEDRSVNWDYVNPETLFNIKSLEAQRQNALKATQNLISALEQGIVTEQTKIRLKELEAQIAGLDFDIGQEKQRNYTYLSPESVEKYLNSIICGDIQEMPVRKLIVKAFVREVVLDNDNVTITYNFTENYTKYRVTQEIIQKVQRQSRKKTAYNKNLCSYKLPPLPPKNAVKPQQKPQGFPCGFCF